MNYSRHYDRLIDRARNREVTGYVERHHILPRCLGGSDDASNIVKLTAEEHYVAHQLLVKMHPGNHKLVWALKNMTKGNARQQRNNKEYGWTRRLFAKMLSETSRGRTPSAEARAKMSAARKGVKRGNYKKRDGRTASFGKPKSDAHRSALAAAKLGTKRGKYNYKDAVARAQAIRDGIAASDKSRYSVEEYRAKQSADMKRIWAQRKAAKAQS